MSSVFKSGNTAVITGASSGIGRAAALYCADEGMKVWMVDVDAEELALAKELVQSKATAAVESRVVDVSNLVSMQELATQVYENGGACHFLMNNAGIGSGGGAMTDMDMVHKVMGVNTYGPMHGCLAFVPRMKETESLIVNTGSKQGITCPPGNMTYNMSKAALKVYTEGLSHELMKEGSPCKVALLVPGWVNTSIVLKTMRSTAEQKGEDFSVDSVFFHEEKPAEGAWMPRQVIDFMVQQLNDGKFYIICPDNDVDQETDKLRMTWTMQDITQDRQPLSRWHPDYKDAFAAYLKENGK